MPSREVYGRLAPHGAWRRYIGQLMRNTGTLFANDLRRDRCKELRVIVPGTMQAVSRDCHFHPIHSSSGDTTWRKALVANVHRLGLTNVVVSAPQQPRQKTHVKSNTNGTSASSRLSGLAEDQLGWQEALEDAAAPGSGQRPRSGAGVKSGQYCHFFLHFNLTSNISLGPAA